MTKTSQPSDEPPLVLLLEAEELRRPIEARGAVCRVVRSLQQLTDAEQNLDARVIVLGDGIFELQAVEGTIVALRRAWPLVDIVVWSRDASVELVREALRAGARDVITTTAVEEAAKDVSEVIEAQRLLPRAVRLGEAGTSAATFEGMVSRSPRMWDLFDTASRVATTDATVLVLGETGTGKELLSRAIHERSARDGRFVAVDCGAVQSTLIDSELFGHEKGAFTGALSSKAGLFRHADHGTLMLDEIGNLPLAAQYRLLRALQEGAVRPVGGHSEQPVDVRVIAATSTALDDAVRGGAFREDLFYRLDVIRLELPPLRDRREDIIYLFGHFARACARQYNVVRPDVTDGFLDVLVDHDWPGNVRQLQNFTERFVLTRTGQRATAATAREMLPDRGAGPRTTLMPPPPDAAGVAGVAGLDTRQPLDEALRPHVEALERSYLEATLRATRGAMAEAADHAGISRRTLLRKLKRYGIDRRQFQS